MPGLILNLKQNLKKGLSAHVGNTFGDKNINIIFE